MQELSIREVKQLLAQAKALFENALINVESEEVVEVVERTSLSAYDCEYVALAHRLGCPFVTYDSDILDQFPTLTYEPTGIPNE